MKTKRHAKILEIIHSTPVDTQDELLKRLRECGFDVTQATVSRDIKELRLIKTLDSDGRYRYSTVKQENDHISSKFHSLFSDAVVGVDYAGNIVVIKCFVGMAQAVCAAMDSLALGQCGGGPWRAMIPSCASRKTKPSRSNW